MYSDKVNPWLAEKLKGLGHDPALRLIVEVEPGRAEEVVQQLRRMGVTVRGKPLLGIFIPVTVPSAAYIDAIARIPGVVKIHYDSPVWIKPVLPIPMPSIKDPLLGTIKVSKVEVPGAPLPLPPLPAAILPQLSITQFHRAGYEILPTEFSRRVMVDVETTLLGRNVRVAVLDTGAPYPFHPQVLGKTVHALPNPYVPEDPFDHMGHGCLRNVKVYTSEHGLIDLEKLWEINKNKPINVKDGEFKPFSNIVYTVGTRGITKARGIFRVKSKIKVIIRTPLGTIEATPWHKFYVANPCKSTAPGDGHKRWKAGYTVIEKRADELKPSSYNAEGDWLVFKAYSGETWSLGGDPELAYLGGLIYGDGTIIYNNVNIKNGHIYKRRGTRNEITIVDNDRKFLEKVSEKYGGKVFKTKGQNSYTLIITKKNIVERVIPYIRPPINDLESLRAWIAGFFDAEGYVNIRNNRCSDRVVITNTDIELLSLIKDILNIIGIPSTITDGGISKGSRTYHLVILVPQLFYKFVEPYIIKKKDALRRANRCMNLSKADKIIKYDGANILVPIKDVEIIELEKEEYFYDLADTDEGAYSASGFLVHNSWCSLEVAGLPFKTRFGRVAGVAWGADLWHVKVLSTLGFGSNTSVIWGMQRALEIGAKVVSMSLGGPAQGGVEDDPNCKAAKILYDHGVLVVVAAGNDGPSDWTVDSPGYCPWVLTVASVSLTDDLQVAWFSSRGPSAKWYREHSSQWQEDLEKYGDLLVKPDVAAPGGGRHRKGAKPEEVLYQGSHGWFDGFYDYTKDMFEAMMGTSMATPTMAGVVTLLAEAYPGITVDEIKKRLRATADGEKNTETGWGVGRLSRIIKI